MTDGPMIKFDPPKDEPKDLTKAEPEDLPGSDSEPDPLNADQVARVAALYHARSVLESEIRSGGFGTASTKPQPKADDLLAVAEYIISGDLWLDDDDGASAVGKELKE